MVDIVELLFDNLRVDLGGRDIGMTQHFLDRTQICSVLQQMYGKRVAQRMGGNILDRKSTRLNSSH